MTDKPNVICVNVNLTPYGIEFIENAAPVEGVWIVAHEDGTFIDAFETKEEAEAERSRLNSKHALDSLGI